MSYQLYHKVQRGDRVFFVSQETIDKHHTATVARQVAQGREDMLEQVEQFLARDILDDPDVMQQWAEQNMSLEELRQAAACHFTLLVVPKPLDHIDGTLVLEPADNPTTEPSCQ